MAFGIKRTAADGLFSDFIRERADWTCERCRKHYVKKESLGGSGLECSHFWSRRNKSVRFDPENASSLCTSCHQYFTANPAEHADFFLKRLGQEKYDLLRVRAHTPAKVDEKEIAMAFRLELKRMKEERKVLE